MDEQGLSLPSSALQLTRAPEAGRTVVLCLPGTYCSPAIFDLLDETAFPSFQFLAVSWMTSPGPWDIPTLGRRVALLLRELGTGPALIAGHSTGGPLALVAALTEPALVRGLLLADTGAHTRGHGDIASIIKTIEAGVNQEFFARLLRRNFFHQPDAALFHRLMAYAASAPREAALEVLTSQAKVDLSDALPRIAAPVVVVHGRYDQARPVAHAEFLVARLPHAEMHLLDCGHTPMVERPGAYQQAFRRLCALAGINAE